MSEKKHKNKHINDSVTPEGIRDGHVTVPPSNSDGFASRMNVVIGLVGNASRLARMADVSESVVRKWRDGKSEPSRLHLVAISRAAGISINWLATGEGPMRPGVVVGAGVENENYRASPVGPGISRDIIQAVVEALEELLAERYASLSPANKAELVALVCEVVAEQEAEDAAAGRETDVTAAIGGAVRVALKGR